MPRKLKSRVLSCDPDGRWATIRLALPDGQIVEGEYKCRIWNKPPRDALEQAKRQASLPPKTIARKRGG